MIDHFNLEIPSCVLFAIRTYTKFVVTLLHPLRFDSSNKISSAPRAALPLIKV